MSFLYPLGLLGLIAVPILILIYIIKNRYTEKIIASTYIWNLSEKFLKRRVPIKLAGLISLILQLLIAIFVSFAVAHPLITLPDSAGAYCFVLDGSGSMNFEQDGTTRFDLAKDEIYKIIDGSANGSNYTLIYVSESADFIFEEVADKKSAKQIVSDLKVGYCSTDTEKAIGVAQEFFDYNPSVTTYLLTDKDYLQSDNIEIINVAKAADNYAVTNVTYELAGSQLRISGSVVAYSNEKELTIELYFDGSDKALDSQAVTATQEGTEFSFLCNKTSFEYFTVKIADSDKMPLDNQVTVYDVASQNVPEILLVSDKPFFIRAALASVGITIKEDNLLGTDEFNNNAGYGLYIFDSFMPSVLPDDGAVWFFNPQGTLAGTNFSYQSEMEPRSVATYSTSTASLVRRLLNGVVNVVNNTVETRTFLLKSYVKCGFSANFTTLITCDSNPILFVGSNVYGNREVVFSFDIHDSAPFALLGDLATLFNNLIDYSFPTVIDQTTYYCGDVLEINLPAGCSGVIIETPNDNKAYPDSSSTICEYKLTEVGLYRIVLTMKDNSERVLNVFAALPEDERVPMPFGEDFTIFGEAGNGHSDGYIDPLIYLFIVIAVLAVADYGVYCYEQYQLR